MQFSIIDYSGSGIRLISFPVILYLHRMGLGRNVSQDESKPIDIHVQTDNKINTRTAKDLSICYQFSSN